MLGSYRDRFSPRNGLSTGRGLREADFASARPQEKSLQFDSKACGEPGALGDGALCVEFGATSGAPDHMHRPARAMSASASDRSET
jgi:hypothetical protein